MSCNKVEISKTATKSKGREEALCCSTERGKLTPAEQVGAEFRREGAVQIVVVGAATTGWRLTQLRPQRAASSPAGIGGPGILPFFNFLQIATRRKREEANKTDVAGGKCEYTESLPTTKLFSIKHFKRCIAQL